MAKRRANHEGSIFKEKGRDFWVAEILVDGKKIRKRSKRQQVVREWLQTSLNQLEQGVYLRPEKTTVSEFIDRVMRDVGAHTLRPKTIDSYNFMIDKHIKPEIGELRLNQLRPVHLQSLYSKKLEEGLSKRTVQYIHAVIRRILNQAVKWNLLVRNPTDAVTPPVPSRKTPVTLSDDQVRLFLKSVKGHRWYPIYVLAVATGMREGEILGLRWEDVDLAAGAVSVRQTIQNISGRLSIGEPKSEKSRRTIPLPIFALDVLKNMDKGEGLIFRTSSGNPVSPRNVLRHFQNQLEKLGLPRVTFHSLRHLHATYLLRQNIHPKVVQERLGHATISLTLDTYSHIIPTLQREAAEKINDIF
jgi:integrase